MKHRFSDMTPLLDLAQHLGNGPLRIKHPVYVELQAPCNNGCQAGEDIRGWLALAQTGHYREAWEHLVEVNPFPAIHGRVCYHPCETQCNRNALDATVSIHAIERFLGDLALEKGWLAPINRPISGKRVLVVGAGPAGLSAAYHLARAGHAVEIREAGPVPGGMMHFGIPAYRLPRKVLLGEIARLEAIGIQFTFNHKVDDVLKEQKQGNFDAVFIAIGAHLSKKFDIPACDAVRVMDALKLLRGAEQIADQPLLGRRVVVYGGGNTAMDSARTAKRLGANDVIIVYRRDRAHMPAHPFELEEAIAEGVQVRWLTAISDISTQQLQVERIELDANGAPHSTGIFDDLPADALVLAIGQEADSHFLERISGIHFDKNGSLKIDEHLMTGHAGIFAGGDLVTQERTVTNAVGLGRRAALSITAWLYASSTEALAPKRIVTPDMLHLPLFTDADPNEQAQRPATQRTADFIEITAGLTEQQVRYEAQRCLSCGSCYECDNCFAACPQNAIIKLGKGNKYEIDLSRCTGCSVCYEQCPCHAIDMQAETEQHTVAPPSITPTSSPS